MNESTPSQLRPRLRGLLCVLLLTGLFSVRIRAQAVANFADGNTASFADGYVGKAGDGWSGPWSVTFGGSMTATSGFPTVIDTSPLASGTGNYLAISTTTPGASGSVTALRREYRAGVGLTAPVEYKFLFRPDTGTSSDYRYFIYDNPGNSSGTGSNNTWGIVATGGEWQLQSTTGSATLLSTGATVTLGTTYAFTVVANPASSTWTVEIGDTAGTVLYSSIAAGHTLSFRSEAQAIGGYLILGVQDANSSSAGNFGFSLDSVSIAAVPEPAGVALALGALGLAAGLLRKRSGRPVR